MHHRTRLKFTRIVGGRRPPLLVGALLLIASCGIDDARRDGTDVHAIYGDDHRRDLFESDLPGALQIARSVAAVVKADSIQGTRLVGQTLGEKLRLCAAESFREQPSVAHCSGFLVSDDKLVTSGHCFKDQDACAQARFVFDYAYWLPSDDPLNLRPENIYRCQSVWRQEHGVSKRDYAIIKLDRKVPNRAPLTLNEQAPISLNTRVFAVGTPAGLPLKVMGGATVVKADDPVYFEATLDSFGGNSGAPVVNQQTQQVEGVLVRGRPDFDIEGECTTTYRYEEATTTAEDVTRSQLIAAALRGQLPPPGPGPTEPEPQPIPTPGPMPHAFNAYADFAQVERLSQHLGSIANAVVQQSSGIVQSEARQLRDLAITMGREAQSLKSGRKPYPQTRLRSFYQQRVQVSINRAQALQRAMNQSAGGSSLHADLYEIMRTLINIRREMTSNW